MHFEVRHVVPNKHYHVKFSGKITLGEVAVELRLFSNELSELTDSYNILWDFSEADISNLSFDTVDVIAKDVLNTMQHGKGKSAYYMDERNEKHLLNFLKQTLDSAGFIREIRLFHEIEQARKYLGFPVEETV